MVSYFCNSCEYDLWELFIRLFFLFFISSPNLLVLDIITFLQGRFHDASTLPRYVATVVTFVTFNIVVAHINISCFIIYSICDAIYRFMSKFITSKKMTIKEAFIPRS
jgi:hypothetical protein